MLLALICSLLFLLYAVLVLYYWYAWTEIPVFTAETRQEPGIFFSIIIPARNEAANIGRLLKALQEQQYPRHLYELIVVDDHSEDDTAAIAGSFAGVNCIRLQEEGINSYKKKAIETGIAAAKGNWILTTDADSLPTPNWLQEMASFAVANQSEMVAAPVLMQQNGSLLQLFQAMDFMILQAITGAVVYRKQLSMCNGANLAYSVNAFRQVRGFEGIDNIASGDDMLLMYKIWKRYPDGVHYLKSKAAIVSTLPQTSWGSFFKQRIRWASKAARYEDKRFWPVLLLVYCFNLLFPVLLITGFFAPVVFSWMLYLWLGKTLAELPLYVAAARFFGMLSTVKWFLFFQPLHILYTVISGLFGQFGKYEWKGRQVR